MPTNETFKRFFLSRRKFLAASAQLAIGLLLSTPLDAISSTAEPHMLSLFHTHTGEQLEINYVPGKCPLTAKSQINTFLRDFRTGDTHVIDTALMDILTRIQRLSGSKGVYEVISGYRSPRTNAYLQAKSPGVASDSLHMRGRAIDVRLTDVRTRDVRDIARRLRAGGVGYYAKSDFVHLDTGQFRHW
jgi:uncharacterized protein YcbK (DUF882 family)